MPRRLRTPVADLLLGRNPNIPGSPLFKSQVEIVLSILRLKDSPYKEQLSLRSYLSQVLTGRRPCRGNLADCILRVVTGKFSTDEQREHVRTILLEAIKAHNEKTFPEYHLLSPAAMKVTRAEIFEEMWNRQDKARTIFIINRTPIELEPDLAKEMSRDFAADTITALQRGKPHVFCVADKSTAILLWMSFFKRLLPRQTGERKREKAINQLNSLEEHETLKVYTIPPSYCVQPTVVFDCDSPKKASGWIWYLPNFPEHLVEMSRDVLVEWIKVYSNPIMAEQLEGLERVTWKDVRDRYLK